MSALMNTVAERTTNPSPAAKRVIALIEEGLGGCGQILHIKERPWASITFSGFRLELTVRWAGVENCIEGDAFLEVLSENEFNLGGLLVADAATVWTSRISRPIELSAGIDLLVLEDPS